MVKIIVVAHPTRVWMVQQIMKHLPLVAVVTDTVSALSGHKTALQIASAHDGRVVVMEDDAIPVDGFGERAQSWFDRFPNDLLSFYLGTGRPLAWAGHVESSMRQADIRGEDFIHVRRLLHGVCYSLPPGGPAYVLQHLRRAEADFAIGSAWGRPTVYPIESLVEHRDTMPVERHPDGQPRVERRVARRLAAKLMYEP